MTFVIPPPPQASLPVHNSSARFPVRRIFCVGRNYAAHAREMGRDPDREQPFFFTKPGDAVMDAGGTMAYPPLTNNLHHEIELVVAIAAPARNVEPGDAGRLIWGYGVGLDMTRRDLQTQAKQLGRPWDWGKAFDNSAPCGPLHALSGTGLITSGAIWLKVNGQTRQSGDIADLIWPVADVISIVSKSVMLQPGDLIMTGTPAGVGPVVPQDVITGAIDGLGAITLTIGPPAS